MQSYMVLESAGCDGMASVNRDPRFPKGVFYARYKLVDRTRVTAIHR